MAPWRCCALLALVALAAAKVYETDDAVIIDLEPEQSSRPARSVSNNELVPQARQFGGSWPPVLPVGPCFTSQGHLGRCTSFRQCYPYFKLPELSNWETWILGMYDTCSYFNSNGRQAFGVCCTNPSFPATTQRPAQPPRPTPPAPAPVAPPTAFPIAPVEPQKPNPIPSQGNVPPNWPPPLPTHPPNHTIPPLPTHPPSPGWPGLPQPAPTQPAYPPPTPAPTRPPPARPPTAPVYPSWPPTQSPARPPPQPVQPVATRPPPVAAVPGVINDASCGGRSGSFDDQDSERIVGGHDAEKGEWPWIAAMFNGGRQFCGGSLIDSTHILSAAHCIAHMTSWDVSRLTVRLGDHNIKSNTETQHVERKVKRLVRHRGFDSRTLYNDIAILTLDSPVPFTRAIRPICLPTGSASYEGKDATVVGWGSLRESGPQPAVLQEVTIPIWTNSECRTKYGNAAPGGIVEHFVCAGRAGRDSCSGDSGGPLMVNEGRWTQVGVVSWGIGCGKGQYPGVYTRVTHFLPWIQKNLS